MTAGDTWPLAGVAAGADLSETSDETLLTQVAAVHDALRVLREVEGELAAEIGKRHGKGKGDLPDGRQYELFRSPDRKEWQHDEWKRDARRVIVQQIAGDAAGATLQHANLETGEVVEVTLGRLLQDAMIAVQNVQGSSAPKSTALKPLGLFASDYCTSSPGGWKFNTIAPSETTTESGEQK